MIKRIKRNLNVFTEYFLINTKTMLEYKTNFVIQFTTMILNDLIWLVFWGLFFTRFDKIKGWGFNEMALLFGFICLAYGISGIFFDNRRRIAQLVNEGQMDYYLTLPINPLLHLLISKMDAFAIGDIIFGGAVLITFLPVEKYPLALFFVMTAIIWLVSLEIIAGTLAFFLGNTQRLSKTLHNGILAFGSYPIGMFDDSVKIILLTVIPVGFISAIPVELLYTFSLEKFVLLIIFTIIIAIISIAFFFFGLKYYESGNLLYTRI